MVADKTGEVTYCNEQFLEILSIEDLVGNQIKEIGIKSIQSLYKKPKEQNLQILSLKLTAVIEQLNGFLHQ